jgi:hypothetical protein
MVVIGCSTSSNSTSRTQTVWSKIDVLFLVRCGGTNGLLFTSMSDSAGVKTPVSGSGAQKF